MLDILILVFIVQFVLLGVVAFFQMNTGLMLYGFGGAILNVGVAIMKGA